MTIRNTKHATFTIERVYPAAPARVFAAWSNKEAKTAWAYCHPEWPVSEHVFDFREGGREHLVTGPVGGTRHVFDAVFHDIVPDQRIVYAYDMHLDDRRTQPRGRLDQSQACTRARSFGAARARAL